MIAYRTPLVKGAQQNARRGRPEMGEDFFPLRQVWLLLRARLCARRPRPAAAFRIFPCRFRPSCKEAFCRQGPAAGSRPLSAIEVNSPSETMMWSSKHTPISASACAVFSVAARSPFEGSGRPPG